MVKARRRAALRQAILLQKSPTSSIVQAQGTKRNKKSKDFLAAALFGPAAEKPRDFLTQGFADNFAESSDDSGLNTFQKSWTELVEIFPPKLRVAQRDGIANETLSFPV